MSTPERTSSPPPHGFGVFEIVGLGLSPKPGSDFSFDDWRSAAHALGAVERYRQFWLGDLLVIGEAAFGELAAQVEVRAGSRLQDVRELQVGRPAGAGFPT